jgi:hypothetical protein
MTKEQLAKMPTKAQVEAAYMALAGAGVEAVGDRSLAVLADILVDAWQRETPMYSGAEQWLACSLVVAAADALE